MKDYLSTKDSYEDDEEFVEDEDEEEPVTTTPLIENKPVEPKQLTIDLKDDDEKEPEVKIAQPATPVSP